MMMMQMMTIQLIDELEDGSADSNNNNINVVDDNSVTVPKGKGHTLMIEITRIWIKKEKKERKKKTEHKNSDYAITAWALSMLPEIHFGCKM